MKISLVTGASRGIGRSIAFALSRSGVRVALTYNTNRDLADEIVRAIGAEGNCALAVQMQVENRQSVRNALQKVRSRFGDVDILVNNAAMSQEKPFESITDDDWDTVLAVNLRGAFICAQETIGAMIKAKWGRIINITSIGGQWGGVNQVHYAASKAGLINLTRSMARIYSKDGITSNAVSPGLVATDMVRNELNTNAGREKVKNIPLGRIATPEEIADTVVFLSNDAAAYITGQTINLNGGMYFV